MLRSLYAVTVRVNDWTAAVDWYRDKLGLEPAGLHGDPFCFMKLPEGGRIALDGTTPASASGTGWRPTISVDDLVSTVATLRARGVTFIREVDANDEGYRVATCIDPEGNPIDLFDFVS